MINPIPVLYLLLSTGILLYTLKRKRSGKIFLAFAGLWFLIITTNFVPQLMTKSLENKYSQVSDSTVIRIKGPCNILVLGGGHTNDKNLTSNNQLSLQALSRLVEGIRIHKKIPGSRLLLSGYDGGSGLSQALVLYRTALILGVDSSSMSLQTLPSNTRMEAEEFIKNFGTNNVLILVTSANHMPRSMLLFRKYGADPIAAPSDFLIKYGSRKRSLNWIPHSANIRMMEVATHEYIGILWAFIGGK